MAPRPTQFVHNEWIESYDPTIEDSYRTQVNVDVIAMRDLYMKTGQGFLLVFSITSASSLAELAGLRDEIIRIKDDEKVPIVICGNKADLEDQRSVPRTKGFSISQRWGVPYYESSARTKTNVDEVFVDLCRQMLRRDDASETYPEDSDRFDPYSYKYYKDKGNSERRVIRIRIVRVVSFCDIARRQLIGSQVTAAG
ncbi:ras family-domain-containing protein [Apiospora kogelbergensis]|uniref:ras family-domain-containing protein n=1 Tax=Apiospora kogelbergensis TaxID=1337665 RepID=UPI00312E4C6B